MITLEKFTRERPTHADIGKWFFVRHSDGKFPPATRMKEVRADSRGVIYLCGETHDGIEKIAYGMPLDMHLEQYTEFCGPIQMYPDYPR